MLIKKVSVVIVNYNVKDLILTSLRTLYKFNASENVEVIVVDNHSADDSCLAIKKEFPQVILLENKYNAGFPKGNNQGFEIATGDYIFMLNPDTEFTENSIDRMLNYLDNHPEAMLLAPKLMNTDGSLQQSTWRYPSITSVFCESFYLRPFLKKKNYQDKNFDEIFEGETFSGAALFFRKELLDNIGTLDETMFWIEDVEFCWRANHHHFKCLYFPETRIIHHIGQSAKKNYNISISNQVYNKVKFFRKHHSKFATFIIVCISLALVFSKIIVFGLLSPFKRIYYLKLKAYIYTIPRVFNPPNGIT
ncbi:glycosyltransferase family 2 protein [Fluviicola taffensis]|uniref:Glycosyl transferase family 2 n=1 Tax=Fluviicola taffensis (strain DSM 16823 / NCIMB 13979 / RW262) TaxID=755732 RepID=F2I9Z6_FLUTR|nr:glycosyltransferase family 2 protein [Fluviicola taffensis]AEA44154.1 glycosyl transferase family 2 [Fluviicola taffensis DSM 16823]